MQRVDIVNDEFLTIEQFAKKYGITKVAQQKLRMKKNQPQETQTKKPYLKYFRIGKQILYKQSDIDEWLESCRVINK